MTKVIGGREISAEIVARIIRDHSDGIGFDQILSEFFGDDANPPTNVYQETKGAIRYIIQKVLSPEEKRGPYGIRYDEGRKLWFPLTGSIVIQGDPNLVETMLVKADPSLPNYLKARKPVQAKVFIPRSYDAVLRVQYRFHGSEGWDERPIWKNFELIISPERVKRHPDQVTTENVKCVKITYMVGDRAEAEEIQVPKSPHRHFVIMAPSEAE